MGTWSNGKFDLGVSFFLSFRLELICMLGVLHTSSQEKEGDIPHYSLLIPKNFCPSFRSLGQEGDEGAILSTWFI